MLNIATWKPGEIPTNHYDHVELLHRGIPPSGGVWADFGTGIGAFTLALADLLGPTDVIYALDTDRAALATNERALARQFPRVTAHFLVADFTHPRVLPPLDGVVMANALHFHRQKDPILQLVAGYLRPGGRFILVEYNTDQGNTWVPYPLSFASWQTLAHRNGFADTRLLATCPSRFLGEIYAALSLKQL